METDTQQFIVQQSEDASQSNMDYLLPTFMYEHGEKTSEIMMFEMQEEPIDLTFNNVKDESLGFPTTFLQQSNFPQNNTTQQSGIHYFCNPRTIPRRKRSRKNMVTPVTSDGKILQLDDIVLQSLDNADVNEVPKYQEILRAAKSLFSKRTRTLYHWMHPNASKQQIKFVVANSWESLQLSEKEFYISQVMERFGYTQGNLMINPQLNNINKELPVLTPNFEQLNAKATELENAISSITNTDNRTSGGIALSSTGGASSSAIGSFNPNFNACASSGVGGQKGKKRANKSNRANNLNNPAKRKKKSDVIEFVDVCNDFQDDPELSQELAHFASIIKNKI